MRKLATNSVPDSGSNPLVVTEVSPGSWGVANRKLAVPSDSTSTTNTGSKSPLPRRSCTTLQASVLVVKVPISLSLRTACLGSQLVSSSTETVGGSTFEGAGGLATATGSVGTGTA